MVSLPGSPELTIMKHLHQTSPRLLPLSSVPTCVQARAGLEPASAEDWLDFLSLGMADLDPDLDALDPPDSTCGTFAPSAWMPGSRVLSD